MLRGVARNVRFFALVALVLTSGCASAGTADPMQRAQVPPDGVITIRDYGARDWGPELVNCTVDAQRFKPGKLVLLDAEGKAVPFQIDGGALSFVAFVGKGQTVTWTLKPSDADRSAENSTLKVEEAKDCLLVSNELFTLRVPKPETKTLAEPLDAAKTPPPILGWKQAGFDFAGGSRLAGPLKVQSYQFTLLRKGPACVEHEARYRFAPKGEYVCRVRVSPRVPLALVTEEFDLGEMVEGRDSLVIEMHKGWKPEQVAAVQGKGEAPGPPPLDVKPFDQYLQTRAQEGLKMRDVVGGFGVAPLPFAPGENMALLEKIAPAGRWGGYLGGFQVLGAKAEGAPQRLTAVIPMFVGSWRRANALNVWHDPQAGICVALPIGVRQIRWYLDIADDISPFSSHEHDSALPASYGRRVWALHFGGDVNMTQAYFGHIGLDRYKDWIVDVPEGRHTYPRAFLSPELVKRIKASLDQHPDKAYLQSYYVISGKPEDALRNAQAAINGMKSTNSIDNWSVGGLSHYRQAQFLGFIHRADDALACPELPKDVRAELRRWLTLHAHLLSEPDVNPRGTGVHLGNPNMSFNRTLALPMFAALLPDHPRYEYWMEQCEKWTRWKMATHTSPCGCWFECPTYQLYSPCRHVNLAHIILHNAGKVDLAKEPYHAATLRYLANLTMPDARYQGWRIIPGMGNSANRIETIWGISMATFADDDPAFAGFLKGMHRLAKGNLGIERPPGGQGWYVGEDGNTGYPFYYLPDVPEKPVALTTEFFPAYGVMFRAHFNTPNETAALLRAGINWSHWDTDALNVILYGRGAPLSPGTGYQYYSGPAAENESLYHNQVKVYKQDMREIFGRVDDAVRDYGFLPDADYAMADRYYAPELFDDGKGEMHWRRHVLFIKSARPEGANYFVMRDTFPGGATRPTWWNWLNVGGADMIQINGNTIETKPEFGAAARFYFSEAETHQSRCRLTFDYQRQDGLGGKETKTILEVAGKPGQDYFYAVYPHKNDEAVPPMARVGDGCIKVQTDEATDYAFISDVPLAFNAEDVVFTGKAGAVRLYKDRVTLCMNSGSGRVGYKGHVFEGDGPFVRAVKLADIKPGVYPVNDTYKKEWASKDIGGGITVEGEAPFEGKLDGQVIRIKTTGRKRVLYVTRPAFIMHPQLYVDGREWMASWTDYPASNWGKLSRTALMALSVPEGEHELTVRDMVYPEPWTRPFTPSIMAVDVAK